MPRCFAIAIRHGLEVLLAELPGARRDEAPRADHGMRPVLLPIRGPRWMKLDEQRADFRILGVEQEQPHGQ